MTIEQANAWINQHGDWIASQQLSPGGSDAMWLMTVQAMYQVAPDRYEAHLIRAVEALQSKFNEGKSG